MQLGPLRKPVILHRLQCGVRRGELSARRDRRLRGDDSGRRRTGVRSLPLGDQRSPAVDDASGVFWYNIEGNNRLWPTFNVFLVEIGTAVYKVQVTDYYSATGASGFPTVRFEQLR